jgi:hypothetical protein
VEAGLLSEFSDDRLFHRLAELYKSSW